MTRAARVAAALLAALTLACRSPQPSAEDYPEERVIARVDGVAVKRGLFDAYLRDNVNLPDETGTRPGDEVVVQSNSFSDDVKSRLLDRFLEEQALLNRAREHGIRADAAELDRFTQAIGLGPLESLHEGATLTEREYLRTYLEDCLLVKKYLESVVLRDVAVEPDEVDAYYRTHASRFSRPDSYRLRLIRVEDPREAHELAKQIGRDGARFLEAAGKLSEGESEQGKELGTWRADQLPDRFAEALAGLPEGQVTGVVEDPDGGFNLIYLESRIEGGEIPIDQVRPALETVVVHEKRNQALAAYLARVRADTHIELVEENLGFHYAPRDAAAASPAPAPTAMATPETTPPPAGDATPGAGPAAGHDDVAPVANDPDSDDGGDS